MILQSVALAFVGAVPSGLAAHVLATKFVASADGSDAFWVGGGLCGAILGAAVAPLVRRRPAVNRALGVIGPLGTIGGAGFGTWMYFAAHRAHRGGTMFSGIGEAMLCVLGFGIAALGLALWIAGALGTRTSPPAQG